jgi:hypothetical protein
MGCWTSPLVWAQAGGAGASANPAAAAYLALRRWCGGLTLSSPRTTPGYESGWIFLAAIGALLVLGLAFQGPGALLRQLFDVPGHIRLAQAAATRVWRAGRLVVAAIAFTVTSWTAGQTLDFLLSSPERGRGDLLLLSRIRGPGELALEHGMAAALTLLRDVAGLADNLLALVVAAWVVFRFSTGTRPVFSAEPGAPASPASVRFSIRERRAIEGWSTLVWASAGLYAVYRVVARAAGSPDLPVGNCLVLEALVVPALMLACDGFLLAWVLVELREAGFDVRGENRVDPGGALRLMPAAMVGCLLALPARYAATAVFLASQHVPARALAGPAGRYIRWQLGPGLIDLQGLSLVFLGAVGVVAWSRGSTRETFHGFRRLLSREAGRLAVVLTTAGVAAASAAASAYLLVLLLPPAGWVLAAADAYAHYATMPFGLWTLSVLVILAGRSLPVATATPGPGDSPAPDAPGPDPEVPEPEPEADAEGEAEPMARA